MRKRIWTLEKCKEEALKFTCRGDWLKKHNCSYSIAVQNKWLKYCTQHMTPSRIRKKWTLKDCKEIAINYKTKTEWFHHSARSYKVAKERNWVDKCIKHMIKYKK